MPYEMLTSLTSRLVPILGAVHARDLDLGSGKLLPTAFAVAVLTSG